MRRSHRHENSHLVVFCVLAENMIRRIHLVNIIYKTAHFRGKCCLLFRAVHTSSTCQVRNFVSPDGNRQELLRKSKENYEDTFGNLGRFEQMFDRIVEDPEDIEGYNRDKKALGKTIGQYIREIKDHLAKYDYKSALRVLEVDMVNDRKRLSSFVYKVLISYNARIGNLEEAYRLFLKYKKRGGFVTGAMYTSMFNACGNCKNSFLAIEKAIAVEECMRNNKNHAINLSNYNAMLKAYGRHGDLPTCLRIVDEVLERRDRVQSETFSFLLQACISDKNSGFRHALIVWRKMLQYRVKPNVYIYNNLLKCVSECSLGDAVLLPTLLNEIKNESGKFFRRKVVTKTINGETKRRVLKIPTDSFSSTGVVEVLPKECKKEEKLIELAGVESSQLALGEAKGVVSGEQVSEVAGVRQVDISEVAGKMLVDVSKVGVRDFENVPQQLVKDLSNADSSLEKVGGCINTAEVSFLSNPSDLPNLISLEPSVGSVVEIKVMSNPVHRFMLLGGLKGFLSTMAEFNVKPNIKTFTLLLNVTPSNTEAEKGLMAIVKKYNIAFDTPFFNVLMKRRIYRGDSSSLKDCLEEMYALRLKPDILTFGILALGCTTHELGKDLLVALRDHGFRANTEILETLLKKAKHARDMDYVLTILRTAKENETELSPRFLSELNHAVRWEERRRKRKREEDELGITAKETTESAQGDTPQLGQMHDSVSVDDGELRTTKTSQCHVHESRIVF